MECIAIVLALWTLLAVWDPSHSNNTDLDVAATATNRLLAAEISS